MSSNASGYVLGFGSTISYAPITSGTIGSYTPIMQTVDVSAPSQEVGDVKITNNSSPNNTHEYAPGLIEPGDVEFDVVYTKAQHLTLLGLLGNGLIYSWKETYPDGTTCVFPGYFKANNIEGKTEDDALKAKVKIKCTGLAVYAGS